LLQACNRDGIDNVDKEFAFGDVGTFLRMGMSLVLRVFFTIMLC